LVTLLKKNLCPYTLSLSLAQQPTLIQVLPQKLLPSVPTSCGIPPVSFPQLHGITPSSHLSFGLPFCLLPSTTAAKTLLAEFCSSNRITWPAHLRQLILMYVTISIYLYSVYNSLLYFILHSPLSFIAQSWLSKFFFQKILIRFRRILIYPSFRPICQHWCDEGHISFYFDFMDREPKYVKLCTVSKLNYSIEST
jgi:hypothetical protein